MSELQYMVFKKVVRVSSMAQLNAGDLGGIKL